MKFKIVHLIQALNPGGCEQMLLKLLPMLDEFDHTVITVADRGILTEEFENRGIRVVKMESFRGLTHQLKALRPIIIFTYLSRADMIGRFFLTPLGYNVIPSLRTTYNYPRYWFIRFLEKISHCWVRKYLANSESVKNFYEEKLGVKKDKIVVVSNGIDLDFENKTKYKTISARKDLGLSENCFILICVANLHPNKGHSILLDSLELLGSFDYKLLIVGDGEARDILQKRVKASNKLKGKVIFMGRRSDVMQLLALSDLFVLPTLFEGMSRAILEAMAMGLPIITTNIPENREIIDDGRTGILIDPNKPLVFSEMIMKVYRNRKLANKLGKNARKAVEMKYDIRVIIDKMRKFIKENEKPFK